MVQASRAHNMAQYDFQMINQDLSESKLLRTTSNFGMLKGRSIADLLYLQTLQLIMFNRDSKQRDYSVGYARKTTQFGPYALFRTTSTDIYVLAFALDNPEYKSLNISTREQNILKSVQFQNRRHFNFVKRMAVRPPNRSETTAFLVRLETQLKITNSLFKQLRRLIIDWEDLKYAQKQFVISKLMQQQTMLRGKASDSYEHLHAMKRERKYTDTSKKSGYKDSPVIPTLTKTKIQGTTGSGIGKIAGYWASGRKKV